ncbi:MAG: DUF222 domain-containing protein [Acidimicrobiia bacterium]
MALDLRHRLPTVYDLMLAGRIDERRAQAMANATMHLSDERARRIIDEIIDDAPRLTTGQLSARIRKLCITADPEDALDRYEAALSHRRLTMTPTLDGTADLPAKDLPPDLVASATRRIDALARSLRRNNDTRTMDQLRADVFLDLLNGTSEETIGRGVIDIRVDLDTLVELNNNPGDLGGYGPLVADIARQTAAQYPESEHRFLVKNETGRPVAVGIAEPSGKARPHDSINGSTDDSPPRGAKRRRSLSKRERSIVQVLRPTCVFPGCRVPATISDVDHIVEFAQYGPTEIDNSAPLCRFHNVVKQSGWSYQPLDDGRIRWVTPSGHPVMTDPDP